MKNGGKIIMAALILLIAGALNANAQRGMRGWQRPDSARIGRPVGPEMQMQRMMQRHMQMWHAPMHRMHPGMGWGYGPGFRNNLPPRNFARQRGFGPAQGPGWIESVPNLTDKQKNDLKGLREKQQSEMKKFREETAAKVKGMRDDHRKKMMDLLTPEQKKYVEENFPAAPPVKSK